jgi:hypothetical protein
MSATCERMVCRYDIPGEEVAFPVVLRNTDRAIGGVSSVPRGGRANLTGDLPGHGTQMHGHMRCISSQSPICIENST